MGAPRTLLELQETDQAIDRLSSRLRALEAGEDVRLAHEAAAEQERQLGELRLGLDAFDRDGAKLEHEIDSLGQKAAAEQRRMSDGSVANARELEAIGREIENLRRRTSDREDELLALLEQRDEVSRSATEAEARTEELRAELDRITAASAEELQSVTGELAGLRARREQLVAGIDGSILSLYDELRASKKGIGAAALVDGVCQGCHETLSAVELDHVRHEAGIARCEHCRRILVL